MLCRLVLFLSLFVSLELKAQSAPPTHFSKIQGVIVNAKESFRDTENETVELTGNVQIILKDQHLTCDRAKINFRAKTLDAIGDVLLVTPKATIGGQRVILDYQTDTGIIFNGYVQSGNVLFEGSIIRKVGDIEYIADDAKYTTCTTCPEAWSFSGKNIRAELGGYAYVKNSLLRIGSVPVFWMPYMILPLKSDRQTGLLTPDFESSSRAGLTFSQGFFWAMSRSQDSTWTIKNYELRGLKGLINYRYLLNETSGGTLDAGFLRDRAFSGTEQLNRYRSPETKGSLTDRWFIKYNHYYDLPDGYIHRAQINNASDLQYPADFELETKNLGDPAMENRTSLTKNTHSRHFNLDASYYKNLLQSDPHSGNNNAVHRLPEIRFSQVETKIGNSDFLYNLNVNYVNFARSQYSYDDLLHDDNNKRFMRNRGLNGNTCRIPNGLGSIQNHNWDQDPLCSPDRDGKYDADTDLIRTGQRLDVQPTISRPIQLQNLSLVPKVSYRETQYYFDVGDHRTNVRRYIRTEVSARTTFSRVFGDLGSLKGERVKHEFQPEVTYTTIPWLHHPNHPFFGTNQGANEVPFSNQSVLDDSYLDSPQGMQFDYNDRLTNRKLITLGVLNKLTRKTWIDGLPEYRQFLSWRITQSYDAYKAEKNPDNPKPWSELTSDLKYSIAPFEITQVSTYRPYSSVTDTSSSFRVNTPYSGSFGIVHDLNYKVDPNTDETSGKTELYTLNYTKDFRFVELIGNLVYNVNPDEGKSHIVSWGYGAQLRMPGDCWYINYSNVRTLTGEDKYKISFGFIWDGVSKPQLPPDMLN